MAALIIPIPDIARDTGNARFRVRLDGREYHVRLMLNTRSGQWILDLYDVDRVAIVTGVALVPWWPLLSLVTDERRPPGELLLYNPDGSHEPPTLTDLGLRSRLVYYEAAA
jgi:hypothetical protein